MKTTLALKAWGNSLGVRIPKAIAQAVGLRADSKVTISVEDERVVLSPIGVKNLSLSDRLALYYPDTHGGEAMATPRIGAERW